MTKKIISVILIIVMLSTFAACNDDNKTAEQASPNITLNDVLGVEGIYCLHSDGTISEGGLLRQTDEMALYYGNEPLVIDRAKGDKLIYIGDMVYLDEYSDNMFEMEWKADKYYWNGKSVDFFEIEIFEGQNIDGKFWNYMYLELDTKDFLEPLGFKLFTPVSGYDGESYIVSKEIKSYTYGAYEGTEWKEVTEHNDIPFYDFHRDGCESNEYAFKAPVIKGKDGYFTIDLTKASSGIYINDFDSGEYDEYVFEIK